MEVIFSPSHYKEHNSYIWGARYWTCAATQASLRTGVCWEKQKFKFKFESQIESWQDLFWKYKFKNVCSQWQEHKLRNCETNTRRT